MGRLQLYSIALGRESREVRRKSMCCASEAARVGGERGGRQTECNFWSI